MNKELFIYSITVSHGTRMDVVWWGRVHEIMSECLKEQKNSL